MKPHVHAALIKAWADGAEIQWRGGPTKKWQDCFAGPSWDYSLEYRIKPLPHKWQKEIDAYVAGRKVQYRTPYGPEWYTLPGYKAYKKDELPEFQFEHSTAEFRIAPETVTQDACICWTNFPVTQITSIETGSNYAQLRNVRFTFEDGKLIDAKVLK